MARDARLRHPEHVHQLLDGELLALEQGEDAHARGVRERLEDLLQRVGAHARRVPSRGCLANLRAARRPGHLQLRRAVGRQRDPGGLQRRPQARLRREVQVELQLGGLDAAPRARAFRSPSTETSGPSSVRLASSARFSPPKRSSPDQARERHLHRQARAARARRREPRSGSSPRGRPRRARDRDRSRPGRAASSRQRSGQRQMRELDPAQLAVKAGDAQRRDALRFAEASRRRRGTPRGSRAARRADQAGRRKARSNSIRAPAAGDGRDAGRRQPGSGEREPRRQLRRSGSATAWRGPSCAATQARETVVGKAEMQEEQEQQQRPRAGWRRTAGGREAPPPPCAARRPPYRGSKDDTVKVTSSSSGLSGRVRMRRLFTESTWGADSIWCR